MNNQDKRDAREWTKPEVVDLDAGLGAVENSTPIFSDSFTTTSS